MTDESLDDAFVPLAFSLHANPGAYAVLSGAGTSLGAGLPSAWGIMVQLANRVRRITEGADAEQLTNETLAPWWVSKYGADPTYSGILEQVGPTQYEREAALREFFDPAAGVDDEETHGPSATHRAIADLMAADVIRIVVTLNFDHLFEDALRARGIEPTVISTEAAAERLPPLHTIKYCIVHLHGDYRDAASMLNTTTELGGYQLHMRRLAERIISEHGLLIAGWSADHDRALCDIVTANHRRYFTHAWITPSNLTPTAASIAAAIDARPLRTTADIAFTRLADAVTAMGRRKERNPLTAAVVVARIKRDLAGDNPAITAHDTLHAEFIKLGTLPILDNSQPPDDTKDYATHVDQVAAACRVPAAAVAALAYWGTPKTDGWWLPVIEQWSKRHQSSGSTAYLDLPLTVAVRLYYAAGVAATAARRYDLIAALFTIQVFINQHRPTALACRELDWWSVHDPAANSILRTTREELEKTIGEALGLSGDRVAQAWQEWETLRILADIYTSPDLDHKLLDPYRDIQAIADTFPADERGPERTRVDEQVDKARADFGRIANRRGHHIEVFERWSALRLADKWYSPLADRLLEQQSSIAALLRSLPTYATGRETEAVQAAVLGTAARIHLSAIEAVNTSGTRGWLDDKRTTHS